MTDIKVIFDTDRFGIKAEGHATGSNEVCNGISAILYTLGGYLYSHSKEITDSKMEYGDGQCLIYFRTDSEKVKAVFEATIIGLLQIEDAYGKKYIRLGINPETIFDIF